MRTFNFISIRLLSLACLWISMWGLPSGAQQVMPAFKDRTDELGLKLQNSAACWVDIDNDGWTDLCTGGIVWRNNAGKNFSKIADKLGTVVAADFDNDGFADLFAWSNLKAYHNNAGKTFTPIDLPPLPKSVSRGACWGDFNGDGFVDLYIGGYEDWNAGITYPNLILMNERGRRFILSWNSICYRTRGVTACDFDEDGDLDVYASNYRLQPNILWRNDGTGRLRDVAAAYNAIATSRGFEGGHSIGACWGDFDNDGHMDLFAGNFAHQDNRGDQPKSRFLRNRGPREHYTFDDRGTCGVFYQESYASPSAGDYDNDGNLDLFFTTVYGTASKGIKNFPVLYRNEGNFVFVDTTATSQLAELAPTYQAAWADYDNDGDLDLATAGKLFANQGGATNWIKVNLQGDGVDVNRSAIGAQARIRVKDQVLIRQVEAGTGEGNQNDLTLHFGLGQQTEPVSLEIFWPNGTRQTVANAKPNSLIVIRFNKTL